MKHISNFLKNSLPEQTSSQNEGENSLSMPNRSDVIPTGTTRGNLKANEQTHTAPGNFVTWFLSHLRRIGAEKSILSENKQNNLLVCNSYFQDLVINNPYFPNNYPYMNVLDAFGDAVVYGKIKIQGFNIKSHIEAFEKFMNEYGHQYRDVQDQRERQYLEDQYGTGSHNVDNVDQQLLLMYGKDIPPIFHKYVTDKTLIQ